MTDNHRSLASMKEGEEGVLERLDLPESMAQRLMTMGFLPGSHVRVTRRAPGGDPRVYRVDGSEIALRHETAAHLYLSTTSSES
jgi:Fe2+ transport system protein FeoA